MTPSAPLCVPHDDWICTGLPMHRPCHKPRWPHLAASSAASCTCCQPCSSRPLQPPPLLEAVCLHGGLSAQAAAPFPAATFLRSQGMLTAQSPHSAQLEPLYISLPLPSELLGSCSLEHGFFWPHSSGARQDLSGDKFLHLASPSVSLLASTAQPVDSLDTDLHVCTPSQLMGWHSHCTGSYTG